MTNNNYEDDLVVMISNSKYKVKFKTREEALDFIEIHCPHLWTKILIKTEDGNWIPAGTVFPSPM